MVATRVLTKISPRRVCEHNTKQSCYVTVGKNVYDVTQFVEDHPGGADLVLEHAGGDVGQIMDDEYSHRHSEAAYDILKDYLIGVLDENEGEVAVFESTGVRCEADLSKPTDITADYEKHHFLNLSEPLLPQLWSMNPPKKFYLNQVHRPRHYAHGSARLMPFSVLEPLSKTPYYIIPLLWLPCIAYGTYVASQGLKNLPLAALWIFGIGLWTLIEYVMHRFLFHLDYYLPDHRLFITLHFLLHGVHHYLPSDKLRLVMPPALFLLLATPFYHLSHLVFPYHAALAVFCGGISGYVVYDCTHYLLHHKSLPQHLRELKSYHLAHHYKNYELGYGVTSKFWDRVFGTVLPLNDLSKSG